MKFKKGSIISAIEDEVILNGAYFFVVETWPESRRYTLIGPRNSFTPSSNMVDMDCELVTDIFCGEFDEI